MILEQSLKNVAMLMSLPEDDIVVTAPTTLMDQTISAQDFAALFGVYRDGGMSWDTFFERGRDGGIFSSERDAEAEAALLDAALPSPSVI